MVKHPEADETCDGLDNDCDGSTDDVDGDGGGQLATGCGGDDCDDEDASVHAGADEICDDGRDNDCDGEADESDDYGEGDDDSDNDTGDDDEPGNGPPESEGGGCSCRTVSDGSGPGVGAVLMLTTVLSLLSLRRNGRRMAAIKTARLVRR
jgi:MYXO-CTERM domain-containing protein